MNNAKILIYTEGEDATFLRDFIHIRFPQDKDKFEINSTWGNTNIPQVENKLKENEANDGINLIIFDADNDFQTSTNNIIKVRDRLGLTLDIFLFPDNASTGDFETLLMQICPEANAPFFDCWDSFDACTRALPTAKSPLYKKTLSQTYCEVFLDKSIARKIKKREIDYTNTNAWNLQHTALNPLFDFLTLKIQEYHAKQA